MRRLYVLTAALLGIPAMARAEWGSMHSLDTRFDFTGRTGLLVHARVRTDRNLRRFFAYRAGPTLYHSLSRHWTALGGYTYAERAVPLRDDFDDFQRAFGGLSGKWNAPLRTTIESLTRAERVFGGATPTFHRYRQRFSWEIPRSPVTPLVTVETLVNRVSQGPQDHVWTKATLRAQLLLGFRLSSSVRLRAGYEYRQAVTGPAIHQILTIVDWTAYLSTR
jgi:hypothetical protein